MTSRPITRRALFGGAGIGVLSALAGCSMFGGAPATVTVTAGPQQPQTTEPDLAPADPTTLLGLLFTTRLHVQHLTAAITEDERDAATFTALLDDRQQHLRALEAEYTRLFGAAPTGSGTETSSSVSGDASTGAADPDEVLGMIRGDATDAQGKFTDALASASRYQAELFGSIAACMATHRMVLS